MRDNIFGTAKETHGFRYTQLFGKARMEMKVGVTFACMNLKKLEKMKYKKGLLQGFTEFHLAWLCEKTTFERKMELGFVS